MRDPDLKHDDGECAGLNENGPTGPYTITRMWNYLGRIRRHDVVGLSMSLGWALRSQKPRLVTEKSCLGKQNGNKGQARPSADQDVALSFCSSESHLQP